MVILRIANFALSKQAFACLQLCSVAVPLPAKTTFFGSPVQARNLMRNTVVVEDLIGSQPLGYRFLFCKMPPLRPISRQLNKSVKAI